MKNSIANIKPDLIQFFDNKKNNPFTVKTISSESTKEIFWKCPLGHSFKQRPVRFMRKGFFYCKNCKDRIFKLSKFYPKVSKIFHPKKNHPITINSYRPWNKDLPYWTCENKHYYKTKLRIIMRNIHSNKKHNCHICNGLEVNEQNNLKKIAPKVASQWDRKKNGNLKPENFFWKSSKRVNWICSRKHTWVTSIYHRTVSKSNCPFCDSGSSLPELRIYSEMAHFFKGVRHRYKLLNIEADIFIDELKTVIEYDGFYFHNNTKRFNNDIKKNHLFKENGYNLIRIREGNLPKIDGSIKVERDKFDKKCIDQILYKLKNLKLEKKLLRKIDHYIQSNEFVNEKFFHELKVNLPSPPYKESLAFINPKLAAEWDYKKNDPLRPENYTPNSGQYAYWRCTKVSKHKSWKTKISNRTSRQSGCPKCADIFIKENLINKTKNNNLNNCFTNIEKVYDFEKNDINNLETIGYWSRRKFYWKCPHCNFSWKQSAHLFCRRLTDKNIVNKILQCNNCDKNLDIKFLGRKVKNRH